MAYDPHLDRYKKYIKMKIPFNDAACLEVYFMDKWTRVTSSDFRCYSGPRRITEHHVNPKKHVINQYEYEGPVYAKDTNIEYIGEVTNNFIHRSQIEL
jgi:hypothetical protein